MTHHSDTAVIHARKLPRFHGASRVAVNPRQDLGFMYSRSLADLDGHIWEPMWMNAEATPSDH